MSIVSLLSLIFCLDFSVINKDSTGLDRDSFLECS